ncbi:MAG: hypothetical protein U5K33_07650 [Halofilum sp. (in: g-proteobacteria)]|nr:hypothetical protein [Halofilum sp. (in: g-proteobacteria)]
MDHAAAGVGAFLRSKRARFRAIPPACTLTVSRVRVRVSPARRDDAAHRKGFRMIAGELASPPAKNAPTLLVQARQDNEVIRGRIRDRGNGNIPVERHEPAFMLRRELQQVDVGDLAMTERPGPVEAPAVRRTDVCPAGCVAAGSATASAETWAATPAGV